MDSTKGYIEGNCLPCCASCNRAKRDSTAEEYINRSMMIAKMHDKTFNKTKEIL